VLDGLSLELRRGEVLGVIGQNGSGKSTAVRLLDGSLKPRAGQALVSGRPRSSYSRRELARLIATVPQELHVAFDFTVAELVMMGRGPHVNWLRGDTADDRAAAWAAMEMVGVSDLAGRSYRQISGGEKQRTVLAMALAQSPNILLLDEPTNNLDMAHQSAFFELLLRLRDEQGLSILAVVHDVNLAALYCDRVLMLREGSVVADGPPGESITPAALMDCFGIDVEVFEHPTAGRPQVALRRSGVLQDYAPGGRL
jgi:ABC-type cobalamin/Fe3+-siderophores transport system ATPase subunit